MDQKSQFVTFLAKAIIGLLIFFGARSFWFEEWRNGFTFLFLGLLTLYILTHKKGRDLKVWKQVPIFYLVMYRTKWGLKGMDTIAKSFPKLMSWLAFLGIIVGFLGMIMIAFMFVYSLFPMFTEPDAPASAGLVLPVKPNETFESVVFFVPFEMWILSIVILAFVHEYAHGIVARLHKIKVKSSGYIFMGMVVPIIPAAFVEPDEKELAKRPLKQQLGVFAAGPFSNVLLAFLVALPLLFGVSLFSSTLTDFEGIVITNFDNQSSPARDAGLGVGDLIVSLDDKHLTNSGDFIAYLETKKPGDVATVRTNESSYSVTLGEHPKKEGMAYLGVFSKGKTRITEQARNTYPSALFDFISWLAQFLYFLFILNIGIGLFNLAPVGPLDGGHMLHATLLHYFKKERATKYFVNVSLFFLLIILINIFFPVVKALLS